ncbi:MAG: PAS domain-containing protein [Spirochaetes bacterium]|nr:PAS domain-containing protein [Spirochaetota bacterium]
MAEKEGWLDPVTRRMLKNVNVLVVLILMGLATASFILWYRLRDRVAKLQVANQKLFDQGELLRLATEATPVGIWDFYPSRGIGYFSEQWYKMFGYEPISREIQLSEWRKFVHPDDLVASEQAFLEYIQNGGGQYESEFRVRRSDGTWCWVLARGRAIEWDNAGLPSRIIGQHMNIQNMKDAQDDLAQSEERFRRLFNMAPLPMVNYDLDGRVIDVNNSFIRIIGYSIDDIPTMDTCWRLGFPDRDYRSSVISSWRTAVKKATANRTNIEPSEYHVTCRDGTVRIMMIGASLTSSSIIVNFFDITDIKRAEEKIIASLQEKEVLLKEIHHRVKNNLQLIISILNLQADERQNDALMEGFREAKNRILSMAIIHEQLYKSNDFSRIDMVSYLQFLTDELCRSISMPPGRVNSSYDMEPTSLGIDIAIPCGLIVNELVSNALKHAFSEIDGTGEISIFIRHNDNNEIALTISDNGIGLPEDIDPGTVKTLGLHLVGVLIKQMRGRYSIDRSAGTRWEILFPGSIS